MPWGSRDALVVLLPFLLAAAVVTAGAGPAVAAAVGVGDDRPVTQTGDATGPTLENTTLTVQLRANGDARWTVTAAFDLATDNETAAFRQLAEEYTAGETASLGLPAFRAAAAEAGDATGREMTITGVERSASPESEVANGTGRLTLGFTWTNFARVDGDRLVVGDVFETGESAWLTGLDGNQRLVLEPPSGYGVISASDGVPAPRNGTIAWEGPTTFGDDAFTVAFTGSTGTTPPNGEGAGLPWLLIGAVALAGGAVVAYVALRRSGVDLPPGPAPGAGSEGDAATSSAGDPEGGADSSEVTAADGAPVEGGTGTEAGAAGDAATAGGATAGGAEADGGDGTDEELLSDEERVERLLEENGGRMKQANIVKETGWSNAKVSQLLSSMDEEGHIDKLRIGRENLISFPEEDVTDIED